MGTSIEESIYPQCMTHIARQHKKYWKYFMKYLQMVKMIYFIDALVYLQLYFIYGLLHFSLRQILKNKQNIPDIL